MGVADSSGDREVQEEPGMRTAVSQTSDQRARRQAWEAEILPRGHQTRAFLRINKGMDLTP